MGDIQTRPFSKNYSGLVNQSVIAIGITVLCVTGQELMKRRRRGKALETPPPGLGTRESWEFGYLYQGRSWARFPSPPTPTGWPLSWVRQAIEFPEDRLRELRGLDATIYIRFLRGCFWFTVTHVLTTFPILFPIHVEFSEHSVSPKSMTRASISSLVGTSKGLSLLWIHICLLFWVTLSWIGTLVWICNGAFKLRAANLEAAAKRIAAESNESHHDRDNVYYEHPHPQYGFKDVPSRSRDAPTRGLRLRTIMVSNIPNSLRNEKDLQEYFEYYMSRKVEKPSMGLTSSTQPGFLNKSFAFLFNRAKRIPAHLPPIKPLVPWHERGNSDEGEERNTEENKKDSQRTLDTPIVERVVVARKMTELASLLVRREEILVLLETAHIKLANKALMAVKAAMERKTANKPIAQATSKASVVAQKRRSLAADAERGEPQNEGTIDEEERMEQLIDVLGPYVAEFGTQRPLSTRSRKAVSRTSRQAFRKLRTQPSEDSDNSDSPVNGYPPSSPTKSRSAESDSESTVWDALLSLPRTSLDAYQPLVNLSHLFRGKIVPSIDYYTAKLNLLTSLITENRARAVTDYDPVSTAFVTFADPADARRACKYLAVHPNNPLACLVTMAPAYQDIDWIRVMKSSYRGEFVKDWVVNIGVWAFTLFWLFPVSLLVGLVSIQNISLFWPSLKSYLDRHAWESEVLQSFIPTLLVALLALLIPLILLLIAKKAHTITTLSALHDRIMTRYYKFLIVNVVVFFCVGTAALQSFLNSFRSPSSIDVINTVATSFPTAGPFYVGWLIFTTAMHGGFELSLLGLPLILYPTTSRQVTPRKRAVGTRPRTFNFYYWLPNHILVIHVLLLFSILNPFVLPFGSLYFFIQSGVVKNQLIHVCAKNYEADGRLLLIRIVRYTLDGLILSQAVFLAYMVVLKKTINVGLAAFLIVFTAVVKLLMTRMCRAQYEHDDVIEADIICNGRRRDPTEAQDPEAQELIEGAQGNVPRNNVAPSPRASVFTWRLPAWVNFSYSTMNQRGHRPQHRRPNPFGPHKDKDLTEPVQIRPRVQEAHKPEKRAEETAVNEIKITPDGYPWNMPVSPHPKNDPAILNTNIDTLSMTGPVVRHPPPLPWDDQGTIDLPYDNPFYTRTIDNVLWLPRNPAGILDLDDTVDLKVAIPVDATAGRLGTWLGLGETESPDEQYDSTPDAASADYIPKSPGIPHTPLPEVDGTEEIDLPLVIAKRVQAKDGVENTLRSRKSSLFIRKASGDKGGSVGPSSPLPLSMRRRPTVTERPNLASFRSFSAEGPSPNRARSSSTLQIPRPTTARSRSSGADQELGVRPDAHAQADFVAANQSGSRVSLNVNVPKMSRTQNVSAAQAIFHEVLEEERQALHDRLEEETAEATKSQSTKSWLTSWMFRRSE
ncbi:hypothetical protein M413DRAFT_69962 [Hebeloma cylindrosporum]|uniref:CSC1/OSCA1-like 7TM region domain-containing protein n=1 Tax=Hebeloma cylindrosporum TaxID=76867 RepID=A0A0C3C3B8_HEBCY|nr:hypothetical protein M413DRAFT_69962 [Hebeloma cylindrosporum h7]